MWLEFALMGGVAGFLAGYLGIGGGLVMVPALTWWFSRDPATASQAVHLAVATSLSTMVVTSLSSIVAHQRRRAIQWGAVGVLAPGLLAGAVAGALLADRLSTDRLGAVFGGFAALAGLQMLFSRPRTVQHPLPGKPASALTGGLIGGVSSLVGIGGGSMTAPWLMWHGFTPQRAIATAAACGYPIALAGTLTFVVTGLDRGTDGALGYVYLPAFLGIALFSMAAAPLGAAAVHNSPAGVVRKVFAVMLLGVALKMLF